MRSLTASFIVVMLWLGHVATTARGEDSDIHLRIEALGKSAEAERIDASDRVRKAEEAHIKEIEGRLNEVTKWTTAQFELGERGVIDKPKVMTAMMSSWQTGNERSIYNMLQFADKSSGAIESGRALNILLTRVGPAAQQNRETRRVDPAGALPLHAATENLKLSEETFDHITTRSKLLGAQDSRRGNADPIDVNWPAVLRDDRWAAHCAAIEKARAAVLNEMSRTDGVSPATEQQLRDAVGTLNADFIEYRKHWRDETKTYTNETAAQEIRRVYEGNTHIRKLIASVYYIVGAKSFADLPQREQFHGGNIEEFLSFMVRNNLEFGEPSKAADRPAYHEVFNLAVRYYLDQNAVAKLQEQLQQELDEHKETSREATDVVLGKTLSAETQAALQIEHEKFIRDLIKY